MTYKKVVGIILNISNKGAGKYAFNLEEDKSIWYNGYELPAEKGDKIEFEFYTKDGWNNYTKVKVIQKKSEKKGSNSFDRVNIDAGNMVNLATNLLIGEKVKDFDTALNIVLLGFDKAKRCIESNGYNRLLIECEEIQGREDNTDVGIADDGTI